MTDPVDRFFEREREAVPVLSPPPGLFDELQTVARRKRNRNTTMVSAAAAVVLAVVGTGAVIGAQNLGGTSTNAETPAGPTAKVPVSASSSPTAASPPVDPSVPADFKAWSVTFVGGGVTGWALGGYTCGAQQCVALLETTDTMTSWHTVARPGTAAGFGMAKGATVRFSSASNGWMVGSRGVYSSHDGGATWHAVPDLSSARIDTVEAGSGGHTYALGADGSSLWVSLDPSADVWTRRPGLDLPPPGAGTVDTLIPDNNALAAVRTTGRTMTVRFSGDHGQGWQTVPSACKKSATTLFYLLDESSGRFVCGNGQVWGVYISVKKAPKRDATFQLSSSTGTPVAAQSISHNEMGTVVSYTGAGLWAVRADGEKKQLLKGDVGYVGLSSPTRGIALTAEPSRSYWYTVTGGLTWKTASFG